MATRTSTCGRFGWIVPDDVRIFPIRPARGDGRPSRHAEDLAGRTAVKSSFWVALVVVPLIVAPAFDERVFRPYVRDVEVNGLGDPYIPLGKIRLGRRR